MFGKLKGDILMPPPKGYDADHPNIELLKLKEYLIHRKFKDQTVCWPQFAKEIVKSYKEVLPLFSFFDTIMGVE